MAHLLSPGNEKQLTSHFSQLPLPQRSEQQDVAGSEDILNTPWVVPLLPPWDCKLSLSRLEFKGGPGTGRDPLETEKPEGDVSMQVAAGTTSMGATKEGQESPLEKLRRLIQDYIDVTTLLLLNFAALCQANCLEHRLHTSAGSPREA